jgi:hypothetical protein
VLSGERAVSSRAAGSGEIDSSAALDEGLCPEKLKHSFEVNVTHVLQNILRQKEMDHCWPWGSFKGVK